MVMPYWIHTPLHSIPRVKVLTDYSRRFRFVTIGSKRCGLQLPISGLENRYFE